MRGTGRHFHNVIERKGITPAHAGNSLQHKRFKKSLGDHPRTCGEQSCRKKKGTDYAGSPPHMRGTDGDIVGNELKEGITPAHAGNSSMMLMMELISKDHPRTCGEQSFLLPPPLHYPGSPPHMRGTANELLADSDANRITPAHAGNSSNSPPSHSSRVGSPPHMRGTETSQTAALCRRRITPAHAGNRQIRAHHLIPHQDHPRTCGEQ